MTQFGLDRANPQLLKLMDHAIQTDLAAFTERAFTTVAPTDRFLPNWHHDAIAWHLQEVLAGRITRLIITMPPRSMKSLYVSVAFPAFALGQDPSLRFICASYARELSVKFANDTRTVMRSDWYTRAFPRARIDRAKDTEGEFATTQRGFRLSTSVGGTLTGRGGHIIIVDDPLKPDEAPSEAARKAVINWFDNTAYSRLDDKSTGSIIVVQQRLHEEDLAGHLLEKRGWMHLDLPAIAQDEQAVQIGSRLDGAPIYHHRRSGDVLHSERESREVLDHIRNQIGSLTFSAQYLQRPVPHEGNLIKRQWFKNYETLPDPEFRRVIQSWDVATTVGDKRDWSVCTTWLVIQQTHYLINVYRARLEYPDLKRQVVSMAREHKAQTVLIEEAGAGQHLVQELRNSGDVRCDLIGIKPESDKETRMIAASARIEGGDVYLPARAPWLVDCMSELLAFPRGRHDDQVDSVSQFLNWIRDREFTSYEPDPPGVGMRCYIGE